MNPRDIAQLITEDPDVCSEDWEELGIEEPFSWKDQYVDMMKREFGLDPTSEKKFAEKYGVVDSVEYDYFNTHGFDLAFYKGESQGNSYVNYRAVYVHGSRSGGLTIPGKDEDRLNTLIKFLADVYERFQVEAEMGGVSEYVKKWVEGAVGEISGYYVHLSWVDPHKGSPFYIVADSKRSALVTLFDFYEELAGEKYQGMDIDEIMKVKEIEGTEDWKERLAAGMGNIGSILRHMDETELQNIRPFTLAINKSLEGRSIDEIAQLFNDGEIGIKDDMLYYYPDIINTKERIFLNKNGFGTELPHGHRSQVMLLP
jgi:hypothetical protein